MAPRSPSLLALYLLAPSVLNEWLLRLPEGLETQASNPLDSRACVNTDHRELQLPRGRLNACLVHALAHADHHDDHGALVGDLDRFDYFDLDLGSVNDQDEPLDCPTYQDQHVDVDCPGAKFRKGSRIWPTRWGKSKWHELVPNIALYSNGPDFSDVPHNDGQDSSPAGAVEYLVLYLVFPHNGDLDCFPADAVEYLILYLVYILHHDNNLDYLLLVVL